MAVFSTVDMPTIRAIEMAGVRVDLMSQDAAIGKILQSGKNSGARPLGVASINLDHIHHFGENSAWADSLGKSVDWLNLVDGAPIAKRATLLTKAAVPRLAGSDLIGPILDQAETAGLRVGFLGGSEETQQLLGDTLATTHPQLVVAGSWSPSRSEITNPAQSSALAARIRASDVQILVVGLGKPRQELWIESYGPATGARVLLAFGAVVDFLAQRVKRAPEWVSDAGMEWAWRLSLEPKRLARRYLVQGPPAYLLARRARLFDEATMQMATLDARRTTREATVSASRAAHFCAPTERALVTAVIVTHNSGTNIERLLDTLREQSATVSLRVIVVDNASTDTTVLKLSRHRDITVIRLDHDFGFAAGVNTAMALIPPGEHLLTLNADVMLQPNSVFALLDCLERLSAGIVVPYVQDAQGNLVESLRREPSLRRSVGDFILGRSWSERPGWLSDFDRDSSHYDYAHRTEWASDCPLLINAEVVRKMGHWDEHLQQDAEIDYQRRVREAGWKIWFEPLARVQTDTADEERQATGTTAAERRIRYINKHRGAARGLILQGILKVHSLIPTRTAEAARGR